MRLSTPNRWLFVMWRDPISSGGTLMYSVRMYTNRAAGVQMYTIPLSQER